eukprot:15455403-Alexandrium_andersonii.AAC.1
MGPRARGAMAGQQRSEEQWAVVREKCSGVLHRCVLRLASRSIQSNHGEMAAPSLNDIVRCRRPRSRHLLTQSCDDPGLNVCRRSSQRPNGRLRASMSAADRPNVPTGGP